MKTKKSLTNISYILIFVLIAFFVFFIVLILNGKNNKSIKNKKEAYKEQRKIESPSDDYLVEIISEDPIKQSLKINGKDISIVSDFYSVIVDKVYKINDFYIIAFKALYTETTENYDYALYAFDKNGKVLWSVKPEEECKKDKTGLCHGTVGMRYSKEYGYNEVPYIVTDNSVSFVSQIYGDDPIWTACSLNADKDYIVEYKLEFKNNGEFKNLKTINKMTAGVYLEKEKKNGIPVDCSVFES